MMALVTTIIPTLDEQLHVERAVLSVVELGPVWVVDSESSDQTVELARRAGARTVVHPWHGYSNQKNWALDHLPIDTDWVMFLDADEVIPVPLRAEISAVTDTRKHDAYYVARRNIFLGRELKHVWWYPDYQLRLFKRGTARYEDREVHEHMECSGSISYLNVPLVHQNLKGMTAFLDRHVRYAAAEAQAMRDTSAHRGPRRRGGQMGRRRAVKTHIWYRLPARPLLRFLWLYLVRRGFLDGRHGLVYAQLISAYEAMIDGYLLEDRMIDGYLLEDSR